jgi:hypothetical protein
MLLGMLFGGLLVKGHPSEKIEIVKQLYGRSGYERIKNYRTPTHKHGSEDKQRQPIADGRHG